MQELSRDALEAIVGSIPAGVVVIEKEKGRTLYVNERAIQLFGGDPRGLELPDYSTKLMKLLTIDGDVFPPEKLPASVALLTGENVQAEVVIERRDGSRLITEGSAKPIRNEKGEVIAAVAIFEDITERKKAEKAVRESERLYKTIFDNSEDGFMLLEPIYNKIGKACDFRFLKLNYAYASQTGANSGDVLGRLASEVTPDLEPEIAQLSGDVAKTGKPVHNEAYNKYFNKWYDSYFFPYATGQVGILFRDITERKKTEALLKESQKKYQDLTETNYDFIWEIDAQGRYTYCSPQMEKLWGLKPAEMIGQNFFDLLPPGEKERVMEFFKGMTSSPKPLTGLQTTSYDRQGRLVYIETNGVPFDDEQGRFLGFRGISRDVTERKKAEEALKNNERLATIGQTAGMVGHDIRNPLQAIVSELYIAKRAMAEAPKDKYIQDTLESLNLIEEEVGYINKIVADLQDYAKPIKPEVTEVEIKALVTGALSTLNVPDNIKAEAYFEKELPKLATDPTIMKRVLFNLANNALQAMPEGGKLTIHVSQDKTTSCIIIAVEDTGFGVPKEIQDKLFTPLFTTKSKGQGFGLAAVKRMVEALGGTVTFVSQEGKGTTFTVSLPPKR